jgi:tRNA pseudouridine38-40 synthase
MTRIEVIDRPGEIIVEVDGDGFLRHMVRIVVGTLVDVGCGIRPPAWAAEALAARDRRAAGQTAPASGLTLVSVQY